jgi:hypothetical protein
MGIADNAAHVRSPCESRRISTVYADASSHKSLAIPSRSATDGEAVRDFGLNDRLFISENVNPCDNKSV